MKPLFALLALPIAAHASWFSYEAGIGVTQFNTEDGRWYQEGSPHAVDARSPSLSAGLTGDLYARGSYGVAWHADYIYLGTVSASCSCVRDENYDTQHHMARGGTPSDFTGSGHVQGVTLTLEPYTWSHGWRFAAEGGVFGYVQHWNEYVQVRDWPAELHVNAPGGVHFAPVAGVSIGRKNWSLSYRHYFLKRNNAVEYPPLWNDADELRLTVKF